MSAHDGLQERELVELRGQLMEYFILLRLTGVLTEVLLPFTRDVVLPALARRIHRLCPVLKLDETQCSIQAACKLELLAAPRTLLPALCTWQSAQAKLSWPRFVQ